MPLAIVSGVVLAGAFLGTLFLSAWAFLVFVAVIVVLALFELDRVFVSRGVQPATPVAIGTGLIMLFGAYANGPGAQSLGLVLLAIGALGWALLYPVLPAEEDTGRRRPLGSGRVAANTAVTCFMTLWVPFLASFAGLLLARPDGVWYVLATVALTVSADIGAFAFGTHFGRHKLAPSVSPGKTWEGFGGGVLTALVLSWAITSRLPGFDLPSALVFAAAVAVAGSVGDLAESLVKRDLGVKDLGRIVPGHGGIMDRADAIVFALPVAHFVLIAFGL
jgi:phosphatidate cytidylyltransferase